MPYVPYKKGTLLIPTGGTKHLFAIITDICPAGSHLLVNVSSVKAGAKHDDACEVHPGEHPFIREPSFVEYRRAEILPAARITKMVDTFVYEPHKDDLSDSLLQALCDGVEDSLFTPNRIVAYFKKHG